MNLRDQICERYAGRKTGPRDHHVYRLWARVAYRLSMILYGMEIRTTVVPARTDIEQ